MDGLNMVFHRGFQCFDESVHGLVTETWDLTFGLIHGDDDGGARPT